MRKFFGLTVVLACSGLAFGQVWNEVESSCLDPSSTDTGPSRLTTRTSIPPSLSTSPNTVNPIRLAAGLVEPARSVVNRTTRGTSPAEK